MRDRLLAFLTVVIVATTLISPFRRELFVGDETKYSQVVHEMRAKHSYLVPLLNGRPYTHKPPVHFWGIVALTYLFGFHSLWAFVLQSILATIALLAVTHRLARELFDERDAWPAVFILASSWLVWGLAQTARMDTTFTLMITLAVLYLTRFLKQREWSQLYLCAAAAGAAILVKGPMALVIIVLLMGIEAVRTRALPRGKGYLLALLIVALIPLIWLIPAVMHGGSQYAHDLLIKQNLGRAVNSFVHREPVWYYVLRAPLTFFPWFFVGASAFVLLMKAGGEKRDSVVFCLSWIAAVVVPFSLLSGKLDVYMLPAFPAMALVAGRLLGSASEEEGVVATWFNRGLILLLAIVTAVASLPLILEHVKPTPELAMVASHLPLLLRISAGVALALAMFAFGRRGSLLRSSIALGFAALAPLVLSSIMLMPQINEISSTLPLIRSLAALKAAPSDIALYACPNLWARQMPEELLDVRYVGDEALDPDAGPLPHVVATRSSRAKDLGAALQQYERLVPVRMIGKDFDVYRRR